MIDGPSSAPSSPPEMPAPTKLMPVSRTAFSRRIVSVNRALPPSTMMSPGSNTSTSASITASVPAPALTMMIAVRGFCSDAANSSYVAAGTNSASGCSASQVLGLRRGCGCRSRPCCPRGWRGCGPGSSPSPPARPRRCSPSAPPRASGPVGFGSRAGDILRGRRALVDGRGCRVVIAIGRDVRLCRVLVRGHACSLRSYGGSVPA